MSETRDPRSRRLPDGFCEQHDLTNGDRVYLGTNVLTGLVDGVEEFAARRHPRLVARRATIAMIGTAMWMDDADLQGAISKLGAACIVISKQVPGAAKLASLKALNHQIPGMPAACFQELTELAPKVNGLPDVVGPYSPGPDVTIPAVRSFGFRKKGTVLAPIVHAKIAILGELWWHDEGPTGHVEDVVGFTPIRLWRGSANFTRSSRLSMEEGRWTEAPDEVELYTRYVARLMGASEDLDAISDDFNPDLVEMEYDDAAMVEALGDWPTDEEN
ncbi:hypothetical protein [Pilimelia anulata]|nr:hypothetical protein [Pilimelia anulata]